MEMLQSFLHKSVVACVRDEGQLELSTFYDENSLVRVMFNLFSSGGEGDDDNDDDEETVYPQYLEDSYYSEEYAYATEMDYPIMKKLAKVVIKDDKKESAYTSTATGESSVTRLPREPIMGPAMYPPGNPSFNPTLGFGSIPTINSRVRGLRGGYAKYHDEKFNLPSAQANTGAILVDKT
ncbi:ORF3 [Canna indica]|uniref:ORF3 n=1 Tax=Canna indica TaxID=4628 RepID=A0AAQ3QL85_9LILI|nr:ORF3 [Canna indica]